jgi:hypothetical protein
MNVAFIQSYLCDFFLKNKKYQIIELLSILYFRRSIFTNILDSHPFHPSVVLIFLLVDQEK